MTFQTANLLKDLKSAQICEDNNIYIDFQNMTVRTIPYAPEGATIKEVKIKHCNGSLVSKLDHLQKLDYIEYDFCSGHAHVNHRGWNATSATIRSAVQFTVRDIIVPLAVTIAATILLRYF